MKGNTTSPNHANLKIRAIITSFLSNRQKNLMDKNQLLANEDLSIILSISKVEIMLNEEVKLPLATKKELVVGWVQK